MSECPPIPYPPPLPRPSPAPSGSIDCCLFLFVHLFGVTAEKRGDGGGTNAAREGEDANLCFILRLCRANGAAAPDGLPPPPPASLIRRFPSLRPRSLGGLPSFRVRSGKNPTPRKQTG